jgi:hypothetical protein
MTSVVPDYCEPLIGYRAWRVTDDGCLASQYQNWTSPSPFMSLSQLESGVRWPAQQPLRADCCVQSGPRYTPGPLTPAKRGCHGEPVYGELADAPLGQYAHWSQPVEVTSFGDPTRQWVTSRIVPSSSFLATSSGFVAATELVGVKHWPVGLTVRHRAPGKTCTCGIYAHKDPDRAIEYASEAGRSAWGAVALWGTVVEHHDGYRAEYAYPVRLWSDSPHAAALASRYGVICRRSQRHRWALRFHGEGLGIGSPEHRRTRIARLLNSLRTANFFGR